MQRACPGPFLVLLLCLVGAVTVTLAQPLTEAERGNVKRLLEMQHRTKVIIPLSEAEFRSVIDPKKFSRDFHVVLMLHAGETREVAHVLKEMTELLKAYNDHLRSHSKEERQLLFSTVSISPDYRDFITQHNLQTNPSVLLLRSDAEAFSYDFRSMPAVAKYMELFIRQHTKIAFPIGFAPRSSGRSESRTTISMVVEVSVPIIGGLLVLWSALYIPFIQHLCLPKRRFLLFSGVTLLVYATFSGIVHCIVHDMPPWGMNPYTGHMHFIYVGIQRQFSLEGLCFGLSILVLSTLFLYVTESLAERTLEPEISPVKIFGAAAVMVLMFLTSLVFFVNKYPPYQAVLQM